MRFLLRGSRVIPSWFLSLVAGGSVLVVASPPEPPAPMPVADKDAPATPAAADQDVASVRAELLAQQALLAEADGDFLGRQRLLNEAQQADPDCRLLQSQQKMVKLGNQWLSIDECVELADQNKVFDEYVALRGQGELNATQHFELARWCLTNGLNPQALAHLNKVIRLEPDHAAARAALGFRQAGDEWVAPETLRDMQRRGEELVVAVRQYGPKIRKIQQLLLSPTPKTRDAGKQQLMDLTDIPAIPAVEYLFADATDDIAQIVIEWLSSVDAVRSSEVLTRYAMLHANVQIRELAIRELRERPIHDFAGPLVAMTVSPVNTMFVPILNRDGTLAGYRQAFAQASSSKNKVRVLDASFPRQLTALIEGENGGIVRPALARSENAMAAQEMNAAIERELNRMVTREVVERQVAVARENGSIVFRNQQIANFLSSVTGEEIADSAEAVWQWWDRVNETDSRFSKENSYGRASVEMSVPRYQALRSDIPMTGYISPESLARMEATARRMRQLRASGSGAMPSAECLVAGTKVLTSTGRRPIETIRTGDLILTRNISSGDLVWQPVIDDTRRPPEPTYLIKASGDQLQCTGGHLFWVSGKGWMKASELMPGDTLHSADEPVVVESIVGHPPALTFNLVVAENSNYFVGENLILTHDVTEREPNRTPVPGLRLISTK